VWHRTSSRPWILRPQPVLVLRRSFVKEMISMVTSMVTNSHHIWKPFSRGKNPDPVKRVQPFIRVQTNIYTVCFLVSAANAILYYMCHQTEILRGRQSTSTHSTSADLCGITLPIGKSSTWSFKVRVATPHRFSRTCFGPATRLERGRQTH
jgi:hypothetical protein